MLSTVCLSDRGDCATPWKYWPVFSPPQCTPMYRVLWRKGILWRESTVEDLTWWSIGVRGAGNEGE